MSYNGSGTFNINTSGQPVVTGTVISSTAFNALTADLATGLSTAITKDGQTATTARIPFAQGITSTLVTDSTSTTTGSIITAGGVGIAKALFVGTTANFGGVATYSAQPIFSSLTASSAVATDASKGLVSVTNTGTGNNVLATSPTLVTPVLGAASATSVTFDAGAVGTPSITTAGDTNTGIFFPAADTIAFAEGGAEVMRIDSSGNLLVGETAVDDSGGLAVIPGYATGAPALLAFNKGNAGSETCLRFKYQGTVVGSIAYSSTATAYNTFSDYRLKEDVTPMTDALAKVAALKPVFYKWKLDGSDGQGFIAHELAEVVPDCVTGEKDAVEEEQYEVTPAVKDEEGRVITEAVMGTRTVPVYQGVDVSFLVATLTAAIQELKTIVDAQAARITALESAP